MSKLTPFNPSTIAFSILTFTLWIVACTSKEQQRLISQDTINDTFNYLPDTIHTNKDLFKFASHLVNVPNIDISSSYRNWYETTKIYANRAIDSCGEDSVCHFIHTIIDLIRARTCTAAYSEAQCLEYGMEFYRSLHYSDSLVQKHSALAPLLQKENEQWIKFISSLFPLIDCNVSHSTGTAGAYIIPANYMEIVKLRTIFIKRLPNMSNQSRSSFHAQDIVSSAQQLEKRINSLYPPELDKWLALDHDIEEINSIKRNRALITPTLKNWINTLQEIGTYMENKDRFSAETISLINNIISTHFL